MSSGRSGEPATRGFCPTYLIVLDFEATCWLEESQSPEIIEFAAVIVHLNSGDIKECFHSFVKPTLNPKLSNKCSSLTGIMQSTVDNAVDLRECLNQFNIWINKMSCKYNLSFVAGEMNCALAAWGDEDIKVFLKQECLRKNIQVSTVFDNPVPVNLQKLYQESYNQATAQGLQDAVTNIGLSFEGRVHSGMDDAKNTAKLAAKMVRDGKKIRAEAY